jgi:hypothetical protein
VLSSSLSDFIIDRDIATYRAICSALLPNVLQALPVSVPQSIRNFAKQLEPWLSSALEGYPSSFLTKKMNLLKKFAQSLHRQGSLNHLTQAARAVLANAGQVQQMIGDYSRLDLEYIRDLSWLFVTNEEIGMNWQEEFRRNLIERASLEGWADWIRQVVGRTIAKCSDARESVSMLQQLLLKWSFFWSLIIRDLTIRNAGSFGSFHLLRTLFDEYLFHLVDQQLSSPFLHPQQQQQQQQQPQKPPPPSTATTATAAATTTTTQSPSSSSPFAHHPHPPPPSSTTATQQSSPIDSFALESVLHHKDPNTFPCSFYRSRGFSDIEKSHQQQDEDYGRWDSLGSDTLSPLNIPSHPLFRALDPRPPQGIAHHPPPPPPHSIPSPMDRIIGSSFIRPSSPSSSLPKRSFPSPTQIPFEPLPNNSISMLDSRPISTPPFDLMTQSSSSVPLREESASKRLRPEVRIKESKKKKESFFSHFVFVFFFCVFQPFPDKAS